MNRLSHFAQGEPSVQRGDIAALYRSRDTDPLRVALGDMYHPPAIFEHGRLTLVADIKASNEDGCEVRLYEARWPTVFYRIEARGMSVSTGSAGGLGRLVAQMALALASGEIGIETRAEPAFDMHAHLARQRGWSEQTFGPGARPAQVIDHIGKELREIEADPLDLEEWIDVVILALDGAWRAGHSPEAIVAALVAKQTKNENRTWPDWRTVDPTRAIEHDRHSDGEA